ncbi:MAG TPA: hypothetical protein VEF55_03100 [Candidatus Binatia bacterium]|nr:hypothetical protein [Candidatus Binatia bacterium]
MDFKSFVDKAKEAAATVGEQAKAAMATPAIQAEPLHNVEAQIASEGGALVPAGEAGALAAPAQGKSFGALASEKINQLSAAGSEKIQELVTSFQQALPALSSAGYELTEFEVELGVTPKLIPHFRHASRAAEDVDAARDMLKDNKLGQLLLGALLKAGDVHKQIKVAGFGFSHIEIEMGLIPSVRLQYKKD